MQRFLSGLPRRTRRTVIGVVGGVVLVAGIFMIPYPGPGWLVVFMGLAILSQEYPWAKRALHYGHRKYDEWTLWIARQNRFVQSLTFIGTTIVVVVTIWLVNGYGLLNSWFNLQQGWLVSPLFW